MRGSKKTSFKKLFQKIIFDGYSMRDTQWGILNEGYSMRGSKKPVLKNFFKKIFLEN